MKERVVEKRKIRNQQTGQKRLYVADRCQEGSKHAGGVGASRTKNNRNDHLLRIRQHSVDFEVKNYKQKNLDTHKNELTQPQRQLLDLMQTINFGRIEHLVVRKGQPDLEQAPRVIREIKLGGENGRRNEHQLEDYVLKKQQSELFEHFYNLQDAVVCQLVVQNGLPIKMSVEEIAA